MAGPGRCWTTLLLLALAFGETTSNADDADDVTLMMEAP
jgi:hypothetical protein